MGAFCGGGGSTTTQTQSLPAYVAQGGEQNFDLAKTLSERPWQQYEGPRVAGFGAEANSAFNSVRQNEGRWAAGAGAGDQTLSTAMAGGQSLGDVNPIVAQQVAERQMGGVGDVVSRDIPDYDLSRYMNQYTQAAMDPTIREVRRGGDIRQQQIGAAASDGAWGGARHGVAEAENTRNTEQLVADILARGNAEAYGQATQLATSDRNAALQAAFANQGKDVSVGSTNLEAAIRTALANQSADLEAQKSTAANTLTGVNLGIQGSRAQQEAAQGQQQMRLTDTAAMLDVGERKRLMEQAGLDLGYSNFLEQQNYPTEMLNLRTAALTAQPYARSTTTTAPGGNSVAQGIGLFAALAAAGGRSGLGLWGG